MTATLTVRPQAAADEVLHELLATPEGQAEPYPRYRRLRELAPLHHSGLDGVWYASGFDLCRQILVDARCGKGPQFLVHRHGIDEARVASAARRRRPSMITVNPPEHSRLRGVAKGRFIPTRMEALRPRVEALVAERLDVLAERGEADVMADLAFPLPVTVIGELVGVPAADRERFRALVRAIIGADRPDPPPDAVQRAEEAGDEFQAYFSELIAERRARRGDDLISELAAADDAGVLSREELYGTVTLLFIAGFLTTTNLIGNGLLALFRHPGEMARLWADPALVPGTVEEILRYDTPVQMVHRTVLESFQLDGQALPAGETVFTLLGAANRDPARFPDPDRFDVGRPDNAHLSFAWGPHFCLGARLARLEGQLVFAGLRHRFSRLEPLVDDPPRSPGLTLRALESLPVRAVPR